MKLLAVIAVAGLVLAGSPRPMEGGGVVLFGAGPEARERVDWAVGRFELFGFELPQLEIHFYEDEEQCDGAEGITRFDAEPLRIDVCNPHRLIILHELAHAWDNRTLTPEIRAAFMQSLGIDEWSGPDVAYGDRGIEKLAQTVVWGLNESGSADPAELEALVLLGGRGPLWSED
jgi:hypothetical protein